MLYLLISNFLKRLRSRWNSYWSPDLYEPLLATAAPLPRQEIDLETGHPYSLLSPTSSKDLTRISSRAKINNPYL
mgnify:FL=1